MNQDEILIWSILQQHLGSCRAIQVRQLVFLTDISERDVRSIVKDLIETHHKPIGSTVHKPYGYYVIMNNAERLSVRNSLYRRALSTLKRARAYESDKSLWAKNLIGQLELQLGEVKQKSRI